MSDNKGINENEINENNIDGDIQTFITNNSTNNNEIFEEMEEETPASSGKWLKIVIIVLILAAIGGVIVFNVFFNQKTYRSYDIVAEYTKDLPEAASFMADYGKLFCYNNEGISIYNSKGEIEWNAAISMTNPKITVSKGYAVVADIGGRNLLVVNHKLTPAVHVSLEMLQDIMLVDISEQGEIAVLMEADKGYNIWLINPYDKNEKLKAEIKTYSKDDGYALSLAMSKDGSKLVTEYVKSENNEIKSTLTFYNFDKIGENSNADRIVGVFPFEDTIFPKLKFADNNTVCAYGDNKVVCFAAKREPEMLWEKKIAGRIERIAEDETGFTLLINESNIMAAKSIDLASNSVVSADYLDGDYFKDEQVESDKSILYSFNYSGNKRFAEVVDINAKGLWMSKGEVALHSENNCVIFDNNGNEKFKNKFGEKLVSFMPTDSNLKYYTVQGKKLKVIKLSE